MGSQYQQVTAVRYAAMGSVGESRGVYVGSQ